jgi:hypothetical protein
LKKFERVGHKKIPAGPGFFYVQGKPETIRRGLGVVDTGAVGAPEG